VRPCFQLENINSLPRRHTAVLVINTTLFFRAERQARQATQIWSSMKG